MQEKEHGFVYSCVDVHSTQILNLILFSGLLLQELDSLCHFLQLRSK